MKPWQLIDSSTIPNNGGELRLYRRGDEYSIMIVGGGELMNSRMHGSEDALAELGCKLLADAPAPRILVGGLGMGFTLAAALNRLGHGAEVVVAELVPAVVAWHRDHIGHFAGHPLNDPRTTVHLGDVAQLMRSAHHTFDAILLDVDNGPEGLTHRGNDWLYGSEGLQAAYNALRSNGILAVWSAGPEASFTDRLRRVGFHVDEHRVRAHHQRKGATHTIWLAQRTD